MSDDSFTRAKDEHGAWVYSNPESQIAWVKSWEYFRFSLVDFDDYLNGEGWESPKAQQAHKSLVRRRGYAIEAWQESNLLAAEGWLNFLQVSMQLHEQRAWLLPLARHGKKFPGRKKGSEGPVKVAVRKVLKRSPGASAAEAWAAIKSKTPKGMAVYESSKLGKYIETDGSPETKYARFANIVSEVKKELRGPK